MQEVLDVFKKLNIDYKLIRHPAIFCKADEYKVKDIDFGGVKCKNLLLKVVIFFTILYYTCTERTILIMVKRHSYKYFVRVSFAIL